MKKLKYVIGCLIALLISFQVSAAITADFTYSIDRTSPLKVTFVDASTPTPSTWKWDFGDGSPQVQYEFNTTHLYAAAGNYTVTLTVTKDGVQNVTTKQINVSLTLGALFTVSKTAGIPPLDVTFDCSISTGVSTGQVWTISPGLGFTYTIGDQTSVKPTVRFTTTGTYTVKVTVINSSTGGSSTSSEKIITVANKPVVDFDWDKPVYVGRTIHFTDKTQYPCNSGIKQTWSFNDSNLPGNTGTSTATNPDFTFSNTGTFDVKLTVTDYCGNSVSATKKVTVSTPENSLFPGFTSVGHVRKGQTVTFTDTSTPQGSIKWWSWWFEQPLYLQDNDNPIQNNANALYYTATNQVTHQYNNAGTFKVRLYIGDQVTYAGGQPLPNGSGTYVEHIIQVTETPELNPTFIDIPTMQDATACKVDDVHASGANYITLTEVTQGFFIQALRLNSEDNSGTGVTVDHKFKKYAMKDNLVVRQITNDSNLKYLYVDQLCTVNSPNSRDYICNIGSVPNSSFSASTSTANIDISIDEISVLQAESNGIFLYYVKKGTSWETSAITKTMLESTVIGQPGKVFIDANQIVALANGKIFIVAKNGGVWDFQNIKIITSYSNGLTFRDIGYSSNAIIASLQFSDAGPYKTWPVAVVYEKPSTGWLTGMIPTASLTLDYDSDVSDNTQITTSGISVSSNYAALKLALKNGSNTVNRVYVYKKWGGFWISSNQTYKIRNTDVNISSETTDFQLVNGLSNKIELYNYQTYCMQNPYSQTTQNINGANNDVVNATITLGSDVQGPFGIGYVTINSGARINYLGINIDLKPGFSAKSGSTVDIKAVATCDDLYFR